LELLVTKETLGTKQKAVSITTLGNCARLKPGLLREKLMNRPDLRRGIPQLLCPECTARDHRLSLLFSTIVFGVDMRTSENPNENLDFV
jgi:hypothetical protein